MDSEDHIGEWVVRIYAKKNYQNSRGHKVESRISGNFVTNCGRKLRPQTLAKMKNRLEFFADKKALREAGFQTCYPCS